ncbi:MAG: GMC family oxidoreductase [Planctomycetes bacterium]|nr:GMC family oxidoreductase [Planctomycetota bacterium]
MTADVCVIGTGMGGCSLLHELLRTSLNIVIIEAGEQKSGASAVAAEHVGRSFAVPYTRAIQLGGTTNLWHGICTPLDLIDFESRPWIPHSGWPITRQDLEPYYVRAASLLAVPNYRYFQPPQLPDHIRDRVADLPFDHTIVENKIFQLANGPLELFPKIERDVAQSERVKCFTHACALELHINESNCRANELSVRTTSRRKVKVSARCYVLCAGGLETPRLLLNSTGNNPAGVGNERDLVGRFLADHPQGNLCQIEFSAPRRAPLYSDLRIERGIIRSGLVFLPEVQQRYGLPNHAFYLRPSFQKSRSDLTERVKKAFLAIGSGQVTREDAGLLLRHPVVLGKLLKYKRTLNVKYRYADVFCQTEQTPNPRSRVSLSEKRDPFGYRIAAIDWDVSQQDLESLQVVFQLIQQMFLNSSFKRIDREDDLQWNSRLTSAAHHLGTARMGSTLASGVVDENLQVFGQENVFICDGSVFPTAGNANPSLTICALALRLADRLVQTLSN